MTDLFAWADEQAENLGRVSARLSGPILAFCRQHRDFHMEDLRDHLQELSLDFAPDSPSRILRELRLQGLLDYVVVNRRASAYRVTSVR